jgi:dienelactone hydrolase
VASDVDVSVPLRIERIPTPFVEEGHPVRLKVLVRAAPGSGPHPVLLLNHGSTGRGDRPALFREVRDYPNTAAFFNARGWTVVMPQRRGRGGSGGRYAEGLRADGGGYDCDPGVALAGLDRATDDVDAVMRWMATQDELDTTRVLIAGVSRGGALAIACAGRWPLAFVGAVQFNGGWLGRLCDSHVEVNRAAFLRGARFDGPTLWLHGSHDPYYRIAHCRDNFDAFVAAGGRGTFHACRAGHGLIGKPALWHPLVDGYLRSFDGRPSPTIGGP